MIPGVNHLKEIEVISIPSLDYKMEIEGKRVTGMCDGAEAMKQAIFAILNTERYKYPVYSWNYGVELQDLIGMQVDYVMSELQRRITEALMQDDRIKEVDSFSFEKAENKIRVTFTVHTVFGDISGERWWNNV